MMCRRTSKDGRRTVLRDNNITEKVKSQAHKIDISRPEPPPPPLCPALPPPQSYPSPRYIPVTTDSTFIQGRYSFPCAALIELHAFS